jgi:hypothetical protein
MKVDLSIHCKVALLAGDASQVQARPLNYIKRQEFEPFPNNMPSIASTIFKIRAHSDYIAPPNSSPDVLSFRKGQPFYALSADYDRGIYFVSTQFAVPFSRTAVSGLVPMQYFEKVDLLSKDPPMQRRKTKQVVLQKASQDHTLPDSSVKQTHNEDAWKSVVAESISSIKVMSLVNDMYCIKVVRGKMVNVVVRSVSEFIKLAAAAGQSFPRINAENYPLAVSSMEGKIRSMELYLNNLVLNLLPQLPSGDAPVLQERDRFLNPKDKVEFLDGQMILRRDSGATEDSAQQPQFDSKSIVSQMSVTVRTGQGLSHNTKSDKNPFVKLSKMVFGAY